MFPILGFVLTPIIVTIQLFLKKALLNKVHYLDITFLVLIVAGFISLIFTLLINRTQIVKYDSSSYKLILLLGINTIFLQYAYSYILEYTNPIFLSSIIEPIVIIMVAFVGRLFFNEQITIQMWAGIVIIVVGIIIFINGKSKIS